LFALRQISLPGTGIEDPLGRFARISTRHVIAIPRTRPSAYPAILSYGFRPFFLLASLQAAPPIFVEQFAPAQIAKSSGDLQGRNG